MPKSPNGSGSIWRRSDNRFNAALTYAYFDPQTGRTRRKRETTTKKTWEAAHRWLVAKKHDALGGPAAVSGEDPLLSEHASEWLTDVVEPRVAINTYNKREIALRRHILPALGHVKVSGIGARRIQALYSHMTRGGYSLATRREIHITLRMCLEQAVRWGILERNPCEMVDAPKGERHGDSFDADEKIRALTDEQARRLFAVSEGGRWRNYYVAAIRTGLRPGEMLGLRWGDLSLDTDPGSVRIRRTLDTHSTARYGPPKSEASRRTVALHWEALAAFSRQREMLEGEGLPSGGKDLVFPSTTGTPMSAANLRNRYLRADLEAAGLPRLTLHELRHTFASIALYEWRLPAEVVQAMMGHQSIKMTVDLYGHLMPGAQESAILALRRMQKRPEDASDTA